MKAGGAGGGGVGRRGSRLERGDREGGAVDSRVEVRDHGIGGMVCGSRL